MGMLATYHAILVGVLCPAISCGGSGKNEADQFVKLVVPLNKDGTYSLRAFCRVCNETLKSGYPIEHIKERNIPLTEGDKRLLKLANLVGIDVRLEPRRLVLRLPNSDCAARRGEQRRNLERLLGIPPGTWPADLGLSRPKGFDPAAPSILFVHGLQSSSKCFKTYFEACRKRGIQVLTFDYPNRGDLKEAGERLAKDLRELEAAHPKVRLVLVSHSMGGLVSRHALEGNKPRPTCVSDLFLLGVPHKGSKLARHEALLQFVENLGRSDPWRTGFGEAGCDLEPGSKFLTRLEGGKRDKAVRYHVFAGSKGLVQASDLPALRKRYAGFLERLNLPQQERARRLAYFDGLAEIVTGKGDGAVALDSSTGLADTATRRVLPLDHLQLLTDPKGDIFRSILAALDRRPR
jgi:pimeloyl-ACP methyl ester carboxylesterase